MCILQIQKALTFELRHTWLMNSFPLRIPMLNTCLNHESIRGLLRYSITQFRILPGGVADFAA